MDQFRRDLARRINAMVDAHEDAQRRRAAAEAGAAEAGANDPQPSSPGLSR
jgi:hypothetical protein